jgi:hypothetical protein
LPLTGDDDAPERSRKRSLSKFLATGPRNVILVVIRTDRVRRESPILIALVHNQPRALDRRGAPGAIVDGLSKNLVRRHAVEPVMRGNRDGAWIRSLA